MRSKNRHVNQNRHVGRPHFKTIKSVLIYVFAPRLLKYEVSNQFVDSDACKNSFWVTQPRPQVHIFGTKIINFPMKYNVFAP
jgi:hypothetical protein